METLIKLVKTLQGYERHYRMTNGTIKIEFTPKPEFRGMKL